MAQNKQALKRRIRSIKATKKITGAMEMIAASKLSKQKSLMETNRLYANTLYHTFHRVLAKANLQDISYLKIREGKTVTLVFVSDMGLCGAYNTNVVEKIRQEVDMNSDLWLIGSKEGSRLRRLGYSVVHQEPGEHLTYGHLTNLVEQILKRYQNQEIAKVQCLYTQFTNSMTFTPILVQLLPIQEDMRPKTVDFEEEEALPQDIIFEPDPITLINQLIPMLMNSMMFSIWLETKTSEQAARRMAMDNATDNAEDLIDELVLKFNQTRQAAITQEITEIVAGAQAL